MRVLFRGVAVVAVGAVVAVSAVVAFMCAGLSARRAPRIYDDIFALFALFFLSTAFPIAFILTTVCNYIMYVLKQNKAVAAAARVGR